MRCLVTGATGFVGGHVAEALAKRGMQVRTLARAASNRSLLDSWGVEVITGDLTDPASVTQAAKDVDLVVHCAAKVGEWGPLDEYRKVNVDGTRVLLDAVKGPNLQRFVLISSLGVYPARDHHGTDETEKLPDRHIDSYTQTKVEEENLARAFSQHQGVPLVVLRPGFVYGPRDRTVLPRILKNLEKGLVRYIASAEKLINQIYVGNIVEAVHLALENPAAVGQVYNITDGACVTKRVFFETIADLASLPRPTKTIPMSIARIACTVMELAGKTFGYMPMLTSARLKFMGLNLDYSIAKARKELGYNPSTDFATGIRQTIDWLKQQT